MIYVKENKCITKKYIVFYFTDYYTISYKF